MQIPNDINTVIQQFEALVLEQKTLLERQEVLVSALKERISESIGEPESTADTISIPPSLPGLIPREEGRSLVAQAIEASEFVSAVVGDTGPRVLRVEIGEDESSSYSSSNSQEVVVRYPTTIEEYLPPDHILVACSSPRNINVGDRVYVTNQISHNSGNELRDRFGTVKKVNILRSRVVFETDSGTTTNRKVKNVKLVVNQNI